MVFGTERGHGKISRCVKIVSKTSVRWYNGAGKEIAMPPWPPKVDIIICQKCQSGHFQAKEKPFWFYVKHSCSFCKRKDRRLNVYTDDPPDNCQYLLEQMVSTEE